MIITNFQNLAKNDLRKKALEIAEAGYEAIEIKGAVKQRIKIENNFLKIMTHPAIIDDSRQKVWPEEKLEINLNDFKRVFIIGIGKGSALASAALAEILSDKLTKGIALDVQKPKLEIRNLKLEIFQGSHPLPSEQNIQATQEIIQLAESLEEGDLLINFICGGGSALACASEEELKDASIIFQKLTKVGATITELNAVRKHLSKIKGGGLAKMACRAQVVSLVVSDVCGNDLSMVSSGPTVFDKTTKEDAEDILKKYGLDTEDFHLYETPKEQECFKNVRNILFVCNQDAVMAMAEKARELGFEAKIYSLALQGEAMDVFTDINEGIEPGQTILAAGEATVTLEGRPQGKGGRNMEAVLGEVARCQIPDDRCRNSVIMSFTSDGRDNTEAAGAIGDLLTLQNAKKIGLIPQGMLRQNQSFIFFDKVGDLMYVEQRCFNVADLMIVLKGK